MEDPSKILFQQPEYKSILILTPDIRIQSTHSKPNWWWRTWQFFLFGWQWRNLTSK